ncbi:MAG TPA: hemerythrin domain-containing protein [Polyangiaceae bacterium]|nr:hemerythrin domain-containing protein [Polyangiaceae bacterium]
MSTVPNLLNDDGTASIATAFMMSHHGFRRDLARFASALENIASGNRSNVEALREEWKNFHMTLHGHHEAEDNGVFPSIAGQHESVRATIEALTADHRRIDPLLERGNTAFEDLPRTDAALAIVRELKELLERHLALEERELIPFLRDAKTFPPPPNDEAVMQYAEGFAWSMQGIAPDVLEQVYAMLPESLRLRIPAACAAFEVRCERVWGSAKAGTTRTPIPAPSDDVEGT